MICDGGFLIAPDSSKEGGGQFYFRLMILQLKIDTIGNR